MPLLKYRDFTGGMCPDVFVHKQLDTESSLLKNYRAWKNALTKVGGQEVEVASMPLSQPTLIDYWRQQFGVEESYFVTAKAGHVWKTDEHGVSSEISRGTTTGVAQPYTNVFVDSPVTVTGASSVQTVITCSSTAGLQQGMTVSVTSGTGALVPGTGIVSIFSATSFSISTIPTTPLVNATLTATSELPNNVVWTSDQLFGGLTFVTSNQFITPQFVTNNQLYSPGGLLRDLPGWLWDGANPLTFVSQGSPGVVTTSRPHGFVDGDRVDFAKVQGMVNLNTGTYYAKNVNSLNFQLFSDTALTVPVNTSAFPAYTQGGVVFKFGDKVVVARTAGILRSFNNQLWAGNINNEYSDGSFEYLPNVILYSDISTSQYNTFYGGYIPYTWQPSIGTSTSGSTLAGQVSLDTSDPIVDMVPLRDNLLVFTTNSSYFVPKVTQVGQVLNPQLFSSVRGLISNDCFAAYDGRILFVTTDDIMITTGSSIDFQSLANSRIKDDFFNSRLTKNVSWQQNIFCRYNRFYSEIWIFFPSTLSVDGSCDQAYIWDIESNSWTIVDVPNVYSATYAPTVGNGTLVGLRNWTGFNYAFARLHFQSTNQLLVQDIGFSRQYGGSTNYQTIYEKVYDLESGSGDAKTVKDIKGIYPFVEGDTDLTIQIKFSNIPFSTGVDWTTPDYEGVFTTAEDYKIDPLRNGRYMAIRMLTNDSAEHEITAFDIDVELGGRRG